MNPIVLIPARMAATRLPGKPLALIDGIPMVVRALRCAEAAAVGPVAVAAGDPEIVEAVSKAGGLAVLTDPCLPSGSDRILAALRQLDPDGRHDAIINMQGDMPFSAEASVRACTATLAAGGCDIATVVAAETDPAASANADVVKAVLAMDADGLSGRALYFTRSTLYGEGPVWRHIGVYGYRRAALETFNAAPPSPLERREKLEQLRAMELGLVIRAGVIDSAPIAVDSPADLEAARAFALTGKA
jgi:3-deoxy-manno-octulosonate cytidylyltransferase (CMP-KDO synthetase)